LLIYSGSDERWLDTYAASNYNIFRAEVAQSVEQRFRNSKPDMPICAVSYKRGLLCQLPEPRFEAKVPFGDILSFLVCRQNVAKNGRPLRYGSACFSGSVVG